MKFEKRDLLPVGLLLLAMLAGAYYYEALPETMATHFGVEGEANGWMGKNMGLSLPIVIGAFVYLLLRFLPWLATKQDKKNILALKEELYWLTVLMAGLIAFAQLSSIYANLGNPFPIGIFSVAISAVIFYSGYLMTRAKRNYFVGMRLPWTLASNRVWDATNRIAGKAFMGVAVAYFAAGFYSNALAFTVLIGGILATVAFSVVYSFVLSKR